MADRKKLQRSRLPTMLAILIVIITAGITVTLLRPGFVECAGYLEPVGWIPLFASNDGLVTRCELEDGMSVDSGELLVGLDDDWPRWNLERVSHELKSTEAETAFLEQSMKLFSRHRELEEEELRRLTSANLRLMENSSISRSEYERTEFLYGTFVAGADREEAEFKHNLLQSRYKAASLKLETRLWQERLDECRITAPESGTYYSSELLHTSPSANLIPHLGLGKRVESGSLIGYLIPDRGMKARIRIPQQHISRCQSGQNVFLSINARPLWRFRPVTGRLVSIVSISSGGSFIGIVELTMSGDTLMDLKSLNCGDLTARIDTNNRANPNSGKSQRLLARIWDYWSIGVNSIAGRRK